MLAMTALLAYLYASNRRLFCDVVDQPEWILDIGAGKLGLIFYDLAAILDEASLCFREVLDGDFKDGAEGRARLDEQVDVLSVQSHHLRVVVGNRKTELLYVKRGRLGWVRGLNQNVGAKTVSHLGSFATAEFGRQEFSMNRRTAKV